MIDDKDEGELEWEPLTMYIRELSFDGPKYGSYRALHQTAHEQIVSFTYFSNRS